MSISCILISLILSFLIISCKSVTLQRHEEMLHPSFLTVLIISVCFIATGFADGENWNSRGRGWARSPGRKRAWQYGERRQPVPETTINQPSGYGTSSRDSRFLSLFTVVQFDNNVCTGMNGDNGTCISAAECSSRGGTSGGPCANGYGVCCVLTATCGQTAISNNTFFVNTNYPSTFDGTDSCQLTIVKSHPDVCQFRLDFDQFNIRGPETTNNACTNDQFIVSGGNPIPPICGSNNGNHMYVDAGIGQTNPVMLTFVTSGASFARSWKVRITHVPCSSIYRADEGCLQYFTGVSGQVKSFNYEPNTGLQLSNQDYSICIRMERNFCGIQYMPCTNEGTMMQPETVNGRPQTPRNNAFTLTGNTQGTQISSMTGAACQSDWLMIPCASNMGRQPNTGVQCTDRICGGTFNAENQALNSSNVISTVKPFRLIFHTDSVEAPNDVGNRGFCLDYVQQPCTNGLK